jgi:hypothetical protein
VDLTMLGLVHLLVHALFDAVADVALAGWLDLTLVPLQEIPTNPWGGCYTGGEGSGDLIQCTFGDLGGAYGGDAVFGVVVSSFIVLAFYIAGNGDLATPTVLLILLGGVAAPLLPAQYIQAAQTIVVVGIATGLVSIGRRYVLSGAAQ